MTVTVLTPTYNRADKLKALYDSLMKQTSKDFKWLVIDDGSEDNTSDVVCEFIENANFEIEYIKKENGGKHTALNVGIAKITTDLTFIVDSDDYLTDDAIFEICKEHERFKDNDRICGYSFLRQYPNGKINGSFDRKNEIIGNFIVQRINKNDANSDKAEVWKTTCLKEFPFPEFEGEKFLGEDTVWIQMALKYEVLFLNKPIYISEYLPDGLTDNRRKHNIKSPQGCRHRAYVTLLANEQISLSKRYYFKVILQYHVYGFFAKIPPKKQFEDNPNKLMHILTLPLGYIIYLKWKNDKNYK